MLSQKDAVFQATVAVLEQNGRKFEEGRNIREVIKEDIRLRVQIRDLVYEGLRQNQVVFGGDEDSKSDRSLRTYATGLISNWFRKDKRLNGGKRYVPSTFRDSTGTMVHSSDEKIHSLEVAMRATDDDDLKKRLQEAIEDMKSNDRLNENIETTQQQTNKNALSNIESSHKNGLTRENPSQPQTDNKGGDSNFFVRMLHIKKQA